jgi:hypothetical protein
MDVRRFIGELSLARLKDTIDRHDYETASELAEEALEKTAGRQISARGVQIARFRDGQIVERWGSSDELSILQQLGVDPTQEEEKGVTDKIKDKLTDR